MFKEEKEESLKKCVDNQHTCTRKGFTLVDWIIHKKMSFVDKVDTFYKATPIKDPPSYQTSFQMYCE